MLRTEVREIEKKPARRFEDLIAWQKARALTQTIYEITSARQFDKDYALRDQLRRSAVSVMSNLAEGFERGGRSEFHQFLSMSKASCAELRSQIYVAFDVQYIDKQAFVRLLAHAEEVGRIIGGLRSAVQLQRDKGRKKRTSQSSALSPQS
ncbi:MAG: four helix bundle protein [Nitrospiraceae bacterium]